MATVSTRWRRLRQLLLISCISLPCLPAWSQADPYSVLRARWNAQLTGGPTLNPTDPEVSAALQTLADTAQQYWNTMDRSPGRTSIWADLPPSTDAAVFTSHYNRLLAMAKAYATRGSRLQGNNALGDDVAASLVWMQEHIFNPSSPRNPSTNWWDWEIGCPQALTFALTLVYDRLTPEQRAAILATVDYYLPSATWRGDPASPIEQTGANRLDRALAIAVRGALGNSDERLRHARDAISQTLPYVTTSDGFYTDGSFIQHAYVAYTGSYGLVMIDSLSKLLSLLGNSSWAVTDPNIANVYDWVENAYRPLMHDGAMADSVRGRSIARRGTSEHSAGRSLMTSLIRLASGAPADKALRLKSLVKGWVYRNMYLGPNCFTGQPLPAGSACALFPLYELSQLKALRWDNNIVPAPEAAGAHVFPNMDRAVLRGPGFSYDLSLFSNRITAYEAGNGENLKPWWTGMGMASLHNADQQAFDGDYWATVDPLRLAGTTTDHSTALVKEWFNFRNSSNWVGGAQLGDGNAIATLDLIAVKVTNSPLRAKKAWFLFGDKIIAIGAAVTNTNGQAVETIVENRKLNADGSNALTVNGSLKPAQPGWSESMAAVSWAHLAGSRSGGDIGYVFPDKTQLDGQRETRTGTWQAIRSPEANDPVSASYLSLSLPHGVNPTAGAYTYFVLPGRTPAQTAAFAARPNITVLSRTIDLLAVQDQSQGLIGASFMTTNKPVVVGGQTYMTTNAKASVLVKEQVGSMTVAVADPTQANNGTGTTVGTNGIVSIEIKREAAALISASPGITVRSLSPTVKLDVNVANSAGRSFIARLQLSKPADVSARLAIQRGGLSFDRATQLYNGQIVLVNNGTQPLAGPLRLALTDLPGGVSLVNAAGMYLGAPYLEIGAGGMAPGVPYTLTLQFSNPQRVALNYTPRVLASPF